MNDPRQFGTHPNVVVGVTIIAVLMLFQTFFWISLVAFGFLFPVETGRLAPVLADYASLSRIAGALGTSAVITAVVWAVMSEPA